MDDYAMDSLLKSLLVPNDAKQELFTVNRNMYDAIVSGRSEQLVEIFDRYIPQRNGNHPLQNVPAVYTAIVRKWTIKETNTDG